jgi:hypothetical protein
MKVAIILILFCGAGLVMFGSEGKPMPKPKPKPQFQILFPMLAGVSMGSLGAAVGMHSAASAHQVTTATTFK